MVETKKQAYDYQIVEEDLLKVKQYTLSNGMELYLSVNPLEPRIFTNIAVRSGSKQDPPETTGMAHYMEHMLFKGTSKIGATDWEKEKALLEQIAELYEQHRSTKDEAERSQIYAEIDRISNEAAKLVAPNEYDKLTSSIGANATNAYTWLDQTVYVNDIPANELERWMELESERFRMMALRLFHTELETVYEEFNISQDKDFRKVNKAIRSELFPAHPYGTQTTIGSADHLRNPSHRNIQKYFDTYYVPNNMAIVLAGDFDPDQAVALAEKYFGTYQKKEMPSLDFPAQPARDSIIEKEIVGQEAEYVTLAWRFGSAQSDDPLYLSILQHILYNQQAGLLDLNLNQQQKVLESEAWAWYYQDHSVFGLFGRAREGQSLEEVKTLLLSEIENLKQGNFEEWLIEACIKDFQLGDIRASDSNQARVGAMTQSFVLNIGWKRYAHRVKWMRNLRKEDILKFVNERLQDNYVVVYKRTGEDKGVIKVEKPPITSVELQRDAESEFAKNFLAKTSPRLQPVFPNFTDFIQKESLAEGLELDYVYNPSNELFQLNYIFEMGKNHELLLSLALQYLPYLGTSKYSPSELQQEFFRLGLNFEVHNNNERCYVTLEGLPQSFEEGIQLFEHILSDVRPNEEALQNVIADVIIKRANSKQNKNVILRDALSSYARYGEVSPFTWRLTEDDLKKLTSEPLLDKIKSLTSYEHKVYYYGQAPIEKVSALLKKYHKINLPLKPIPEAKQFAQLDTQPKVIFLDYPTVQADVMMISKGTPYFNLEEYEVLELFNNYFGYGLSSIVFQEIREAKALAYSTYAFYSSPAKKDKSHYLLSYVGTQPDKLEDAIPAMLNIINNMPVSKPQIKHAQDSILRRLESERIGPAQMYWKYRASHFLGYGHDLRENIYQKMQSYQAEDLVKFQEQHVKNRDFTFVVLGSKDRVDLNYLQNFGPIDEVNLEQVFGF